ncbi:acyl carrier protein [Haloferula luteola]|uniref:Acyl carrier protein n=1 Tax=Haloferula luteola TaxID=595692 RepID=A0A840V7G4_9BACT|nr:phosphopantetheine-binding protein [Haloferula luteola]MBB5353653.1 acyl carrier protein [Haloferula luteola]
METELLEILREQILDAEAVATAQTDLFAAGLDSMGIMQLVLAIEETFGIALEPTDLSRDHFRTIDSIAALLKSKA